MKVKYAIQLLLRGLVLLLNTSCLAQNSINLQQALQKAKQNNLLLKVEKYNIGISEADVITARLRPNLFLNNQSLQLVQPAHFSENTNWNNSRNRQTWWQLTKPIQWPGQRKLKISTASRFVAVSNKEYEENERSVLADVANKWLDTWVAQKQLDILLLAKANTDSLYKLNQYRYEKQVITFTDLLRTQLITKQYEQLIRLSEQERNNELNLLTFLLGTSEKISIDTADTFSYNIPEEIDSLIFTALSQRPDILMTKSLIAARESDIRLQRRLAKPQSELGVIWNPQNSVPYLGIFATVEIPLFARNQGVIRKSVLLKNQAFENLNLYSSQAKINVVNTYKIYTAQKRNLKELNVIMQDSEQILRNVQYAYLRGGTSIIDFLEAQRSWLETRQLYYDSIHKYRQSLINLLTETGLISQLAQ